MQHALSLQTWLGGEKAGQTALDALKTLRRRKLFQWVGFTAFAK